MTTEIKICMGSACFARGNAHNAETIEKYITEHNLDAKIELFYNLSLDDARMMLIDELRPKTVDTELDVIDEEDMYEEDN